jgi:hypothetical protein
MQIRKLYTHKTPLLITLSILLFVASCKEEEVVDRVIDGVPILNISTLGSQEIKSKTDYLSATISIRSKQVYEPIMLDTEIRGRGNSTWFYRKKPYRIKLKTATSLFGLSADKDWVLLANYLDGTFTLNAVAMQIGALLEMPFTNHIIPVELNLNGKYQGLYLLTEQIEVDKDRINIGNDGLLLEFDSYYNESAKFKSEKYDLPVLIHHPEITNPNQIQEIKDEFTKLESLINSQSFPNNNYLDQFDADAMAKYFIVYLLTDNQEINHPKSTYFYKPKNGKYTMGPIWDFDWAYNYEDGNRYFTNSQATLFWNPPSKGTIFFSRIMTDPKIRAIVKLKWIEFRATKFNQLLSFIDSYSNNIATARNNDFELWNRGNPNFKEEIEKLKGWLQNRAIYIDNYLNNNFEK